MNNENYSYMYPFKSLITQFLSFAGKIVAASSKLCSPCAQLSPALSIRFPPGRLSPPSY